MQFLCRSVLGAGMASLALAGSAVAQPLAVTVGTRATNTAVINLATGRTVNAWNLGTTTGEARVVLTPDGATAFVSTGGGLFRLRLATADITALPVGASIDDLVLNADGTRLYVATTTPELVVFDTGTGAEVSPRLPLAQPATRLARAPAAGQVLVLSATPATVTVVDTASMTVARTIATDPSPVELLAHPDGTRLFVIHSTRTTSSGDGDSVVTHDWTTGGVVQRIVLPDARTSTEYWPGPTVVYSPSVAGQPAFADGRLFVPRVSHAALKGGTVTYREVVDAIDAGGTVSSVTLPVGSPGSAWPGGIAAGSLSTGGQLWVASPNRLRRLDAQTLAVTDLAAGTDGFSGLAVEAAPPCWFDLEAPAVSFREGGGVATIAVPTPPEGCQWTATTAADWIGLSPSSGSTADTVTVTVPAAEWGRHGVITIGGQAIPVTQRVGRMFIDRPAAGAAVTGAFQIVGWALDSDGWSDVSRGVGVAEIVVYDETPGDPVQLVGRGQLNLVRPDVSGAFGLRYDQAGYQVNVPEYAVRPGTRQFVVRVRLSADDSWLAQTLVLNVARSPIMSFTIDTGSPVAEPGTPRLVLTGWAYDERPASGCGVSEISFTAVPDTPGPAVPLGNATLGISRPDVAASVGFSTPFLCGWRLAFDQPPVGPYQLIGTVRGPGGEVVHTFQRSVTVRRGPFGVVDTPGPGADVAGAISLTGWALDDEGVSRIDVLFGNTGTRIAQGIFVDGVRPDVAAVYPTFPDNTRGGWGVQVLTNLLPNGGNGTLRFRVIAYDTDNNATTLGDFTVNGVNDTSNLPFGTLDTPVQGATVSGVVAVFGWVLTPPPAIIPLDGSTIEVLVDGQVVGRPVFNQCRGTNGTNFPPAGTCNDDIMAAFGLTYRNLAEGSGAIGSFALDTTLLTDGLHELAWRVTDSLGAVQGIGSRFIYVNNGGASPSDVSTSNYCSVPMSSASRVSCAGSMVRRSSNTTSSWMRAMTGGVVVRSADSSSAAERPGAESATRREGSVDWGALPPPMVEAPSMTAAEKPAAPRRAASAVARAPSWSVVASSMRTTGICVRAGSSIHKASVASSAA